MHHVEEIYDLLRPYAGRIVIAGAPAQACWGSVDHYLGVLAAQAGHADWAADHFEEALVIGARLGCPALLAETRLELGALLLDGSARDSDSERAHALLAAAGRTAEALDLQRVTIGVDAALGASGERRRAEPAAVSSTAPVVGNAECSLRRDGDFWTVITPRGSVHVRDAKGMRHLALLLGQPGQPLHVFDLAGGGGAGAAGGIDELVESAEIGIGVVDGFGDAGEVLDEAAKVAYRRRLDDLEEAIAEAERFNDIGRVAQLGAERDMLVEQLAQAVGLGGRDRRAVSVSERARVNVTRAIRSAIRKIGELDPAAGHYLDTCVVTGAYCLFDPRRSS
jgi:hypothetical protein